ncbi:MAG TPA: hypothetical protein IAC24_02060 [Candidatus Onthousia faecigallinarum]|nr:hypothetical protein [Candidatus Onthousia faecigallinarum]
MMEKEPIACSLTTLEYEEEGILNKTMERFLGAARYRFISHVPDHGRYLIHAEFEEVENYYPCFVDLQVSKKEVQGFFQKEEEKACETLQFMNTKELLQIKEVRVSLEEDCYHVRMVEATSKDDEVYQDYYYISCYFDRRQIGNPTKKYLLENVDAFLTTYPMPIAEEHIVLRQKGRDQELLYGSGDYLETKKIQKLTAMNLETLVSLQQGKRPLVKKP